MKGTVYIRRNKRPVIASVLGFILVALGIPFLLACIFTTILHFGALPYDPSPRSVQFHIVSGLVSILTSPLPLIAGIGLLKHKSWAFPLTILAWTILSLLTVLAFLQIACSFNHSLNDPCYVRSIRDADVLLPAGYLSASLLIMLVGISWLIYAACYNAPNNP